MTQTFTDDSFAAGHAGLTDLQNIENCLVSLKSSFSGAGAPSDAVAGMPWFHTTNKILKIRNNDNDAWLGVLYGPATLKTWIYANAATDGWVVDATVTDRVLSLKGGTQAYNANGGTNAGTWTYAGITNGTESATHNHKWYDFVAGGHDKDGSGTVIVAGAGEDYTYIPVQSVAAASLSEDMYTGNESATHTHTISSDATHRPAAAIGTLQYPNV